MKEQENTDSNLFFKPSLVLRIKSTITDSIVIIVLLFISWKLISILQIQSPAFKGTVFALIFLYEPIMTSVNRTVGQKIFGLRVRNLNRYKDRNNNKNINIFSSALRYSIKLLFGWLSLFTIHSNK